MPVLDLIFLPWTTLAYVIAWQPGGADGNREAALVVLGIAMNLATYLHRFAAKSVQTRRAGYSPLRDTTRSIELGRNATGARDEVAAAAKLGPLRPSLFTFPHLGRRAEEAELARYGTRGCRE